MKGRNNKAGFMPALLFMVFVMLHKMKRGEVERLKRANGTGTYWWNNKNKCYISQISYWNEEGILKYKTKFGAKTEYEALNNIELLKESLK